MSGKDRQGRPQDIAADFPYEDIVSLPHPVSKRHAPMPLLSRAAQFAPFAALTGYDAAIGETARLTETERTLSESEITVLNRKLQELSHRLPEAPEVTITCFRPDERKAGGTYITIRGIAKKIDPVGQCLIMESGDEIPMDRLVDIQMPDRRAAAEHPDDKDPGSYKKLLAGYTTVQKRRDKEVR